MSTRSRRLLASTLAACGCATASGIATVPRCDDPAERPPRPSAECFAEPDSQRYAAQLAGEVGNGLSGHVSHPGSAGLSVDFDASARVADVCYESFEGGRIAQRIPDVALRVQDLPPAPPCFAGRRLDLAWESDAVTDEEVRIATAECRRATRRHRSRILFIHEAQSCPEQRGCSGDEVRRRWAAADRALRACVLEHVPLVMRTGVGRETLVFDPAAHTTPDPGKALQAATVCDGLPQRQDVIECMDRRGWQPRP